MWGKKVSESFHQGSTAEGLLHLLMTLSGIVDVDPNGKTAMGDGMVLAAMQYLLME